VEVEASGELGGSGEVGCQLGGLCGNARLFGFFGRRGGLRLLNTEAPLFGDGDGG